MDLDDALAAAAGDAPPPTSRGTIALSQEACTSCMLCARECPDWCIDIASHPEVEPAPQPGGRPRTTYVLDRFAVDFGLCLYCGICIEVCPFDALAWAPQTEPAGTGSTDLVAERDRLQRSWAQVPPGERPAGGEPAP